MSAAAQRVATGQAYPDGNTVMYVMFVEDMQLTAKDAEIDTSKVVCRWHIDQATDCSNEFSLVQNKESQLGYCAFLVMSFENMSDRSRRIIMSLCSPGGEQTKATAILDVASFSMEEEFKIESVELRNRQGDVVAIAQLHTACQLRWTGDARCFVSNSRVGFKTVGPYSSTVARP